MRPIRVPIPDGWCDLDRIARSGQVFRWERQESGAWWIPDGPELHVLRREADDLVGQSSGSREGIERLFRLDLDAREIIRTIERDAPELGPYLHLEPGLRVLAQADVTEVTFAFLCSQNNHLARITPMVRHLASLGEGHRFPSLARLGRVTEGELRSKGFGYRAGTIVRATNEIEQSGGEEWLFGLRTVGYQAAQAALMALPGLGRKLADCVCLFGLGYGEAVPVDTHLWQAGVRLYYPEWEGKSMTEGRYRSVAGRLQDRLGNLAGWAQQFLFVENLQNGRRRRGRGA